MSEFLQEMRKLADEPELRAWNVRMAAELHDAENSDESRSALRLAIAFVKPVTKAIKYTLKTSKNSRPPKMGQ